MQDSFNFNICENPFVVYSLQSLFFPCVYERRGIHLKGWCISASFQGLYPNFILVEIEESLIAVFHLLLEDFSILNI